MAVKFIRNAWYCAALAGEVTRKPLGRVLLNDPVLLYRKQDGTAVAMEDTCPHRRAPLSQGQLVGDNIECPYHGIQFECQQGTAVWAQGVSRIPKAMCLRVYPLVERYNLLWIWMGDPARADAAKIHDCSLMVDPKNRCISGMMPVKANAMLAIDNLMDLSHTAFVHKNSVGSADDLNPEELVWDRGDDWVQGTRMAYNLRPSPQHLLFGCDPQLILDIKKEMKYSPPYNCRVNIYTTEHGFKPDQAGSGYNEQFLTFNIITPETDRSSFYFWADTWNYRIDDEEFTKLNMGHALKLLEQEDKWILEETQRMTDLNPDRPEVDLPADAGGVQARRIVKQLIEKDTMPPTAAVG